LKSSQNGWTRYIDYLDWWPMAKFNFWNRVKHSCWNFEVFSNSLLLDQPLIKLGINAKVFCEMESKSICLYIAHILLWSETCTASETTKTRRIGISLWKRSIFFFSAHFGTILYPVSRISCAGHNFTVSWIGISKLSQNRRTK
jgi:hypothetical protein